MPQYIVRNSYSSCILVLSSNMDGRIIILCFLIGFVSCEYSERGGGATSFSQFLRQFEPSDGHQYRSFGSGSSNFPKEVQVPFPVTLEKKVPYPIKVPVAIPVDRPVPIHVPKPFPVAVDRPVPFPVKVIPVHQNTGKSPFQNFQSYQHQDGFNQPFSQPFNQPFNHGFNQPFNQHH